MRKRTSRHGPWQRDPAVRLRREAWGGFAFQRRTGDLLELDAEGFAVLAALEVAQDLLLLRGRLRRQGYQTRLPELANFLRALEERGVICQAPHESQPLPPEQWAETDGAAAALRAPLVAHWAVTYRCNLHCPFCYSESSPYREAGPDAVVRRRLVERLAAWGVFEVALGGGEPTILPDFSALLAAVRQAGMVPNVTTNGVAVPDRVVQALVECAGTVHLSADRPELLDAARGPGVFARLRDTARALRQAGVCLGVNLLLTPYNVRELRRSLEVVMELGIQAVTFLRPKGDWAAAHWPGFPSADDFTTLAVTLKTFMETRPPLRLYVDTALRSEWAQCGLLEDPEPEVQGCGGGQRHVAITPEGDVYPCSHARRPGYRMGNLLRDSFDELWCADPKQDGRRRYLESCEGTRCACQLVG